MSNHKELINEKLNDKQLQENLDSAMHRLQDNRRNLLNSKYSNWEDLRQKAKELKNYSLANLKDRLLTFEKNAIKNGIKVHWASDADEANNIIYNIIKEKQVDKVLKGKSMATEETHLNHFLKQKGIKAIETDLGELIIQLIDEAPVHIVVPAIHKNRYQVGEIFEKCLGSQKETEPEKLNEIARIYLREEFKKLKIGITGANYAIADKGAIWLLENEGNGRMCSTFPDVHISLCGIEKVVKNFNDAASLTTLLIPSATGQTITCYNNIISGPRKNGEFDGPKEMHVILLDNNRTNMLSNDEYYEALRCIRCGACMNFCPVYDKIGGHAYNSVYPGPIGEVISPHLFGMDKKSDILSLCSLCGRCSEVCPVKIPLADTIRKLRRDKIGQGENPASGSENVKHNFMEQMAFKGFEKAATNGFVFRNSIKFASIFSGLIQKNANSLPIIKLWTKNRTVPILKGDLHKEVQKLEGVTYE